MDFHKFEKLRKCFRQLQERRFTGKLFFSSMDFWIVATGAGRTIVDCALRALFAAERRRLFINVDHRRYPRLPR
jgi:hypothetical protein